MTMDINPSAILLLLSQKQEEIVALHHRNEALAARIRELEAERKTGKDRE